MEIDTSAGTVNRNETPTEGVFGSENLSSAYLLPVTSEDEIDYGYVYALFTFVASMEGQISVIKGEKLELLDDSNSYWWAVKCCSTDEIGYIPAENIETPYEKLARFNRSRNVNETEVKTKDLAKPPRSKKKAKLLFSQVVLEIYLDGEIEGEMNDVSTDTGSSLLSTASSSFAISSTSDSSKSNEKENKKGGFLNRLFSRGSSRNQEKSSRSDSNEKKGNFDSLARRQQPSSQSVPVSLVKEAPFNVVRVFAATDSKLKATFKSVSFEKGTTVADLTYNTLRKFRSGIDNVDNYYLMVTPVDPHANKGSRKLFPDENINRILDSYGIASFLETFPSKESGFGFYGSGDTKHVSKIGNSEGVIKFTIHLNAELPSLIPIRVCYDDQVSTPSLWEKIEVENTARVATVIDIASERFGVSGAFGFMMMNMSSKMIMDPSSEIIKYAQESASKAQSLTFKLIPNLSFGGSADTLSPEILTPPGTERVSRFDPGRSSSLADFDSASGLVSPNFPEKDSKPKPPRIINTSSTFDVMLNNLDEGIANIKSKHGVARKAPKEDSGVAAFLVGLENDLDGIISRQFIPQSAPNGGHEENKVEIESLFTAFKSSLLEFSNLESRLNGMVSHILARNEISV